MPFDPDAAAGGAANGATVTWQKCSLRQWLNSDFYNGAFSDSERPFIQTVTNSNPKWLDFDDDKLGATGITTGGYGGNPTEDNVFLLSVPEIIKYMGPAVYRTGYSRNFFPSAMATATKYVQNKAKSGYIQTLYSCHYGRADERKDPDSFWNKNFAEYVSEDYVEQDAFGGWDSRSPGCYRDSSAVFSIMADAGPQPGYLKDSINGVRPAVWVTAG